MNGARYSGTTWLGRGIGRAEAEKGRSDWENEVQELSNVDSSEMRPSADEFLERLEQHLNIGETGSGNVQTTLEERDQGGWIVQAQGDVNPGEHDPETMLPLWRTVAECGVGATIPEALDDLLKQLDDELL